MTNCLLIFGLALIVVAAQSASDKERHALSVGFLTTQDKTALKKVFNSYQLNDLQSIYYAVLGYKSLGETFKEAKEACQEFARALKSTDLEQVYFGVLGSNLLKETCGAITVPEFTKMWEAKMTNSPSSETILYLVSIAKVLKTPIDVAKLSPILKKLKSDDATVTNLSTIFAILPHLNMSKTDLQSFAPDLNQMLEQADEADGKYLYFEKGTFTTALVVDGIFNFGNLLGKMPDVTEQQVIKLANALYSRRHTNNIRAAAYLTLALKTLSINDLMVPVVVSGINEYNVAGASGIVVPETRKLSLKLTNLFGGSVASSLNVSAAGLHKHATLVGAAKRGDLNLDTDEFFVLELGSISQGLYELEVTAKLKEADAKSPKFVGISGVRIPLRIVSTVNVDNARLSVAEHSQSHVLADVLLSMGKKAVVPTELKGSAEGSFRLQPGQNVRLTFNLVDSVTNDGTEPQQVFVQLIHKTSQFAVTYVAKVTSPGSYLFKLNIDSAARDFNFASGIYSMDLIVGDALLSNSFSWPITDLDIRFPVNTDISASAAEKEDDVSQLSVTSVAGERRSHPLIGRGPSKIKPELMHTFRTPDPRPSNIVAFIFTGLCLSPILVLFFSWPILGANVRNFPFSLSALMFHIGLTGIFGLYLCYWVHLDMFATLRYLTLIGLVTFLAGNRLLRHMTSLRKTQSPNAK